MPEFSEETIVTAEIAGREVPGQVVGTVGTEARYGPGPEDVLIVEVPGAGTWRVPESDITAPV
ncbi:hypothetical protein [Halobacterium sp. CBA1126]|uniref:hypothetical protein n=1 Tax=Halobacterium sp. CBA1126 TaxID=2668074 RepID=UPI0012F7D90B|nr:hypothetical protein [Halobacterium sp. CBA1126]MUV59990.1 hypothetical protein [Halobacterium sp. CBA1126]